MNYAKPNGETPENSPNSVTVKPSRKTAVTSLKPIQMSSTPKNAACSPSWRLLRPSTRVSKASVLFMFALAMAVPLAVSGGLFGVPGVLAWTLYALASLVYVSTRR